MKAGGFSGRVLHVDLSRETVREEPLNPDHAERFLGGLGMCFRLAWDRVPPGAHPLSPANAVVIGAGPLVGTDLPSASRVYAVSRLPSPGHVGWCGSGGVKFGCMLKNAGVDHLVIEGRASRPVFLAVTDRGAEIRDAGALWGSSPAETCRALAASYGPPAGVLCIGRAGENRVPFSMASVDQITTLGRGGLGAVLGSKNLKAVVARGSRGVRVADRRRYRSLRRAFLRRIRAYPFLREWQELGMMKSFPMLPRETYLRMKKRRVACVSCPVGCKDVVEIPDGPYRGMVVRSSSMVNLLTPMIYGFQDPREAVKLVSLLDEFGLDMFEFFAVMGFARELCERGLLERGGSDPEIRLDSLASMEAWARRLTDRQGLGERLAAGFGGILEALGEPARACAPALVNGMHPYAGPGSALPWELFGTMELGQLLDARGPHVGSGGSPTYFARRPLEVFPRHLERMGVPADALERILPAAAGGAGGGPSLNVGRLLRYSHGWFAILGSLGVCARAQVNRFYSASLCAELYQAVTGIETDLARLRERAERVWTLYRLIRCRDDGARRDGPEGLPARWFGEAGFKEYVTGRPLTAGDVGRMIRDYHDEWGWDPDTGVPAPATLQRLGLDGL